jgi:TRAP transporter TAXI family solute receptor
MTMTSRSTVLVVLTLIAVAWNATALEVGAPDPADLRQELQQRLDADFSGGLMRVVTVDRVRSYTQHVSGDKRERMLVYFDAELKFLRTHQLSEWDGLNVGSLLWVLGAQPGGIQGVNPAGNKRGDRLAVACTVSYAEQDGAWVPVSHAGATQAATPEPVEQDEPVVPAREAQLQRLAWLADELERSEDDTAIQHLQCRIDQVIADGEAMLAKEKGLMALATGLPGGEYHALGQGIRDAMNADTPRVVALCTAGSAANLEMVADGRAEAALAQNDLAYMAHHGQGLFEGQAPMAELRALCSVFPEAIQIVTREDAGIAGVADLRGRAVDLGPLDSGTRVNAEQLLAAAGVAEADLGDVQGRSAADALADLVAGEVDAVFVTGVYPYTEISAHAARAALALVPLTEAEVNQMWQDAPFMLPITIPAHTYPGQGEAVRTAGVTALLVAREDLPDDQVGELLHGLFGHGELLARHTAQAWLISRASADRGLSIPVHPAARKHLEEPE